MSGAVISKAHVELLDVSTTFTKKLEANDEGMLSIDLPFGTYEVTASFPAFKTEKKRIDVQDASQTVTFMLNVGGGSTVEVVPLPSGSEPTYASLPDELRDESNVPYKFCSPCAGVPQSTTQLKLDAGPFSILAPLGWEFHQLMGVDSYVGEFVGDGVALRFDFGGYSSGYLKKFKKPAYVIARESIGGFPAKVVSLRTPGHGATGVYFRNVGHSNGLFLWGQDLTSAQQDLALKIFKTIRFGGPMPRYLIPPPPPSKNAQ